MAGGDGTAGWLLGVMGDMRLDDPPPIATMPLGTGNNLPYSFGWVSVQPCPPPTRVGSCCVELNLTLVIHDGFWVAGQEKPRHRY